MPRFPVAYKAAKMKAIMQARVRPEAVEDIQRRILQDRPNDLAHYVELLQSTLPSYFMPAAPTEPVVPTPGAEGYNDWFIKNLAKIAGAPPTASGTTAKTPPPRQLSKSDPTFDKKFVAHVEAVANGTCEIVP